MSSPISRIVTMYRIAWKNIKTGSTGHGEFVLSLKEAEASLLELKKNKDFKYSIESEDMDSNSSWAYM